MAITFVQKQPATILIGGVASAQSGIYSSNPTVGNHLIATSAHWNATTNTTATASDTATNTWARDKSIAAPAAQQISSIHSAKITATGASFRVTITISAASSDIFFNSGEFSGLDPTVWVDTTGSATNTAGASTTSLTVTTGVTALADELLMGSLGAVGSSTAEGISDPPTVNGSTTGVVSFGVSQDTSTIDGGEFCYKILTATGTQAIGWTYNSDASGNYAGVAQAYKGAVGSTPGRAISTSKHPGKSPGSSSRRFAPFTQGVQAPTPPVDPAAEIPAFINPGRGPGNKFFPQFKQGVAAPTPPVNPSTPIPSFINPGRGPGNRFFPNFRQGIVVNNLTPIDGTLATTNNNDTLSAAGTTTILGTLSTTNNNDTLAASGTTTILGTSSTTNNNDTLAASGTTTIVGTLAKSNANDTLSSSGTTTILGFLAYTNNNDTLSASGNIEDKGSLAYTNNNDTLSASGTVGTQTDLTSRLPMAGVGQ